MKKIIYLCFVAAIAFACDDNDGYTPNYGDKAEVETIGAAQDAIDQGSSEIIIKNALTEDSSLTIPKSYQSSESLSIKVPAGGKDLTISQGTTGSGSLPILNLDITNAKDLIVNTPDMSVNYSGEVAVLTSYTAENTLTIEAGAKVGTLNVQKGNVRQLGTVTTIGTVATGSSILYPVSTAAELRTRMTTTPYNNGTNGGVVLMANITGSIEPDATLGGITNTTANQEVFRLGAGPGDTQPATPYDGFIIDGNGYSISGAAYSNVLTIYANNVTVKDLTILQTESQKGLQRYNSNTSQLEDATNNGMMIYARENVKLVNLTIKDCGKYGLLINGATATVTNITTSGNSWGGINVDKGLNVTTKPGLNLVSANISESNPVYVESEADITVPAGWTNSTDTEGNITYKPGK